MNVIPIGPIGAGKSTLGRLVAEALGVPQISMDDIRFKYYREIGYDDAVAKQRYAADGFWGVYRYWKPFEAYAVERVLAEHADSVTYELATHIVYTADRTAEDTCAEILRRIAVPARGQL